MITAVQEIPEPLHGGDIWGQGDKAAMRLIDFSSNVNPLGPPRSVSAAIRRYMNRIEHYPDIEQRALRKAISKYVGVGEENIIAGNGSTELIYLLCDVLTKSNSGQRRRRTNTVCIPAPTFGEYERAAKRAGARVIHSYADQHVRIKLEDLIKKTPPNGIVFICNPNNPNGQLWDRNQIEQLVENAQRQNAVVCVDESFIDFIEKPADFSVAGCVKQYRNLVVLKSFTKPFCLPGLRVGYVVSSKEIISKFVTFRPPWSVNCFAEVCAIAALNSPDYLERTRQLVRTEKSYLKGELARMGLLVIPSHANFLLIDIRKTGFSGKVLKRNLVERYGLLVRDCSSFKGLDKFWIRIAIKKHEENRALVAALKKLLKSGS
jgi:threonine-phosphate decarboxylase